MCVYICVFHMGLSQRYHTAALSPWHLIELFIRVINDIQPVLLIIHSLPYTAGFMLKYCLPRERERNEEIVCVCVCVFLSHTV